MLAALVSQFLQSEESVMGPPNAVWIEGQSFYEELNRNHSKQRFDIKSDLHLTEPAPVPWKESNGQFYISWNDNGSSSVNLKKVKITSTAAPSVKIITIEDTPSTPLRASVVRPTEALGRFWKYKKQSLEEEDVGEQPRGMNERISNGGLYLPSQDAAGQSHQYFPDPLSSGILSLKASIGKPDHNPAALKPAPDVYSAQLRELVTTTTNGYDRMMEKYPFFPSLGVPRDALIYRVVDVGKKVPQTNNAKTYTAF